jgi:hypothetical protein
MARPPKKGLDYFPFDVDFFEKEEIKFLSVECGSVGICALIKLRCNIFRNGYYIDWGEDHAALFAWDMRGMVAKDEITGIINTCLKRGIFSRKLYEKYSILTSKDIQDVFLKALDGKRQLHITKEFWLSEIPDNAVVTTMGGEETGNPGKEIPGKRKKNDFIPPAKEEVVDYFNEKGYTEEAAKKAYEYYAEGGWKDSKGKPVKNWRQKMIAVWFKPEYLKQQENGKQQGIEF